MTPRSSSRPIAAVEVRWSDVCVADVRRIHWRTAERICAEVFAFAATGEGSVERIDDSPFFSVRVPGAVALCRFETADAAIFVIRIHGAR
jgi:hypothetical protein